MVLDFDKLRTEWAGFLNMDYRNNHFWLPSSQNNLLADVGALQDQFGLTLKRYTPTETGVMFIDYQPFDHSRLKAASLGYLDKDLEKRIKLIEGEPHSGSRLVNFMLLGRPANQARQEAIEKEREMYGRMKTDKAQQWDRDITKTFDNPYVIVCHGAGLSAGRPGEANRTRSVIVGSRETTSLFMRDLIVDPTKAPAYMRELFDPSPKGLDRKVSQYDLFGLAKAVSISDYRSDKRVTTPLPNQVSA